MSIPKSLLQVTFLAVIPEPDDSSDTCCRYGSGSQWNGFGEDALSHVWRQGPLCDHVYRTMHQILQVLLQPYNIQKGATFSERR